MKLALLFLSSSCAFAQTATKSLSQGNIGNLVTLKLEHVTKDGVKDLGAVKLGMFNSELPKTTESFEWACSEHFANSTFHRIIPGFMAQGGDFTRGNGTGGKSKFGEMFEDENFIYRHDKPGALSMANRGPNTNGSQFFITFVETNYLNGKHVVFGCVAAGHDIMTKLEATGSPSGKTTGTVRIKSCAVSRAPASMTCAPPAHDEI